MTKEKEKFDGIVTSFSSLPGVSEGKMMSSPALKYEGKVFAFFHQDKMCFKLVEPAPLIGLDLPIILLSPFKTKPPLKGWYWVDQEFDRHWHLLTETALERMVEAIGR